MPTVNYAKEYRKYKVLIGDKKCAGGPQGHPHGIFWELHVPTIRLWCCSIIVYVATNNLICLWCCNMFMVSYNVYLYDTRISYT